MNDETGTTKPLKEESCRPEVLFFDSNETMLDLSAMKPAVTKAFSGRDDLMSLWFTTMLHYSLVDTVTNNYHDFGTIGAAVMNMIAQGQGVIADEENIRDAVAIMRTLPTHPDVLPALKKLKDAGFRMYPLTNSPDILLEAQMKNAGISKYFDGLLSIDGLNIYKPHPRTYHWAAHQAKVTIGKAMLIAAHGWDVAGARLAGMRAAFIERPGKTLYPLGPDVEISAVDLGAVADRLIEMPE
jgi:2-haloacid dehalogenase